MDEQTKKDMENLKETPVHDPVREFLSESGKNETYHKKVLVNTPQSPEHEVEFVPEELQGEHDDHKLAKKYWYQVTSELKTMKLLHSADINALIRYCFAKVEWKKCNDYLIERGYKYPVYEKKEIKEFNEATGKYEIKTKNILKSWKPYPEVQQVSKLRSEMLKLEQDFGMTPIARARIGIALTNLETGKGDGFDYGYGH